MGLGHGPGACMPMGPTLLAPVCIPAAVSDGVLACFTGAVIYTEHCISGVNILSVQG